MQLGQKNLSLRGASRPVTIPLLLVLLSFVAGPLSQKARGDDGVPGVFQSAPDALVGPEGYHGVYKRNNIWGYRAALYFETKDYQAQKSENSPYAILKFINHYQGPIIAGHGYDKNLHREIAKGIGIGRFADASKRNPLLVMSCRNNMSPGESPAQIVAKEWGRTLLGGSPTDQMIALR